MASDSKDETPRLTPHPCSLSSARFISICCFSLSCLPQLRRLDANPLNEPQYVWGMDKYLAHEMHRKSILLAFSPTCSMTTEGYSVSLLSPPFPPLFRDITPSVSLWTVCLEGASSWLRDAQLSIFSTKLATWR